MEFFYEEEALNKAKDQPTNDKEVKVKNDNNSETSVGSSYLNKDERTNQIFDRFEDQIGDVYEKTANKLKEIVSDVNNEGLTIQIPLIDEKTSNKAQKYIETLDNNLANMENVATSYWNKMSNSHFWSNVTQNLATQFENTVSLVSDVINSDVTGTSSKENVNVRNNDSDKKLIIGGSRTETELKNLSNNESIYLEYKPDSDFKEIINIKDRSQEINKFLKNDKDLENLMNNIVPDSITYTRFWSIYFYERTKILEMEDKRLKLLANKYAKDRDSKKENRNEFSTEEEEEVGWGDEDDEDDDSSVVIINKEDARESNKSGEFKSEVDKKEEQSAKNNNTDDDNDDDDDDWE